jgi:hypothetical protein
LLDSLYDSFLVRAICDDHTAVDFIVLHGIPQLIYGIRRHGLRVLPLGLEHPWLAVPSGNNVPAVVTASIDDGDVLEID